MPDLPTQAALIAAFVAAGGNSYRLQQTLGLTSRAATALLRGEPTRLRLEQWEAIRAWIAEREDAR